MVFVRASFFLLHVRSVWGKALFIYYVVGVWLIIIRETHTLIESVTCLCAGCSWGIINLHGDASLLPGFLLLKPGLGCARALLHVR